MNPYTEFTCLYTSQKQKKAKTWQDGHIRCFHNNSKIVLYDAKHSVLDSSFHKGSALTAGDELEMDRHLITLEELTGNATMPVEQRRAPPQLHVRTKAPVASTSNAPGNMNPPRPSTAAATATLQTTKRSKWRAPSFATKETNIGGARSDAHNAEDGFNDFADVTDVLAFEDESLHSSLSTHSTPMATNINGPSKVAHKDSTPLQPPAAKRRKVGLSRGSSTPLGPGQNGFLAPNRSPSTQLEFPNAARCTNFTGKNSSQLLRRSIGLGVRFNSTNQYRDGMTHLIYEHLQILVIQIAISLWALKASSSTRDGEQMDSFYRSRGIRMHSGSTLRRRGDAYSGFPVYSERPTPGDTQGAVNISSQAQQAAVLSLSNKEHHSKYSKDDLWLVSLSPRMDASTTFFARSVFYGPSGNDIDLVCVSTKDSNIARDMFATNNSVCAIRLFNAMSEFMMLDNLSESLVRTPLLPVILSYVPPELIKASKTSVFKAPTRVPEKTGCIVLTEDDGINVEAEIQATIQQYGLNQEQSMVLRNFALTVLRAPRWGDKSLEPPPILLVHGVFGAGKSFLIAVLIIFVEKILSKARPVPEEERSCRFLVTSMTNVAVDRILMALLDLNYTDFVRVGSLKKVARRVLPYTAQSSSGRQGEDVKELQSILADDSLSIKERQYVKDALKRFQKQENRGIIKRAMVVGATCVASTFEALDDVSFPIVILDEASQLLEAMSLIPLCRAAGEKMILVGDPMQLSPPINTNGENSTSNRGLSRTLFDRAVEMGIKPVMLKTQYRCHPRIAGISNSLFYSNVLRTGLEPSQRAPLIAGLPTLSFIDHDGKEIQNPRTKSFTNPAEIKLIVTIVQRLLTLNVPENDIGVISLYKSQADGIESELNEALRATGQKGAVQISTVDAFQGSEKDIIIVSTVKTDTIGFIDNKERVNVALTRSRRHLFIVGHSPLLSANAIWGTVIKDHCSVGGPEGFMRGNLFVQKLKTLTPLPPQAPVTLLEDSDSEDGEGPEEDIEVGEHDRIGHYNCYEDEDEELEAVVSVAATVPSIALASRKYMLYEADEDEGEDSDFEESRDLNPWSKPKAFIGKARLHERSGSPPMPSRPPRQAEWHSQPKSVNLKGPREMYKRSTTRTQSHPEEQFPSEAFPEEQPWRIQTCATDTVDGADRLHRLASPGGSAAKLAHMATLNNGKSTNRGDAIDFGSSNVADRSMGTRSGQERANAPPSLVQPIAEAVSVVDEVIWEMSEEDESVEREHPEAAMHSQRGSLRSQAWNNSGTERMSPGSNASYVIPLPLAKAGGASTQERVSTFGVIPESQNVADLETTELDRSQAYVFSESLVGKDIAVVEEEEEVEVGAQPLKGSAVLDAGDDDMDLSCLEVDDLNVI